MLGQLNALQLHNFELENVRNKQQKNNFVVKPVFALRLKKINKADKIHETLKRIDIFFAKYRKNIHSRFESGNYWLWSVFNDNSQEFAGSKNIT